MEQGSINREQPHDAGQWTNGVQNWRTAADGCWHGQTADEPDDTEAWARPQEAMEAMIARVRKELGI